MVAATAAAGCLLLVFTGTRRRLVVTVGLAVAAASVVVAAAAVAAAGCRHTPSVAFGFALAQAVVVGTLLLQFKISKIMTRTSTSNANS